jgi:predicted DCC family thiol-disulfide oxidoreductase YuxK
MVKLGKEVKGRAPVNQPKRSIIRIKFMAMQQEELQEELNKMKKKREDLKTHMVEEQKLAHLNRMKILTYWRKVLRLAKTE